MTLAPDEEVVQVAVRVRIFSQREREAKSKLIIRMTKELQGSKTFITNPDTNEEKEFKFDYSFNSHKDDPSVGPYATQDSVFEDLGKPVLANALEGKNVCLFAYGQTGAGKSYSMIGHSPSSGQGGIIPRTCEEIFKVRDRTLKEADNPTTHEITTEFLEVYCEQINDLLLQRSKWPPRGFQLRMTSGGFACPDTIKLPCNSYDDIQRNMERAYSNRSIASHLLNTTSSRAHTIFKLQYVKTTCYNKAGSNKEGTKETIVAQLNLVDLAGSERTAVTGSSGQVLEEGKSINLSLTTLGNTIKALTTPGDRPSYRDSKLTMLLMQSMTTGKVIMIAAVSPASICYQESLSTLRFAERIKLVKIKVAKNITIDAVAEIQKQMEEMRARMQEEIDRLRRAQERGDPAALEELKRLMDDRSEEERLMREGLQNELERLKETAEERAKRLADIAAKQDRDWADVNVGKPKEAITVPHLLNLHEDPRLAENLVYKIDQPVVSCGRSNPEQPPILEFNGLGIIKNHCFFEYDAKKGELSITPGRNARCFVNGKPVQETTALKHNFRLWLGNNYAFRVAFPGKEKEGAKFPDKPEGKPDYLLAESELNLSDENKPYEGESQKDAHLRQLLNEALRKIEQANIIASDLGIEASFSPKVIRNRETKQDNVVVEADLPHGTVVWSWDQFASRLVDMTDMWQEWQYANAHADKAPFQLPSDDAENPFIDNDYQLVGESDVYLACLGNMIENPLDVTLLSMTGSQEGRLKVAIAPLGKDGSEGPDFDDDNDPFVDDPEEIIGKNIQFQIHISQLVFDVDFKRTAGKPRFKDVFVRYKFNKNDPDEPYCETQRDTSGGLSLRFNYKHAHHVFVDKTTFNHIMKGRLTFQVWGKISEEKLPRSSSIHSFNKSANPLPTTSAAGLTTSPSTPRPIVGELNPSTLTSVSPVASVLLPVLSSSSVVLPALPQGWKCQMAFIAPDGSIHWEHPNHNSLVASPICRASSAVSATQSPRLGAVSVASVVTSEAPSRASTPANGSTKPTLRKSPSPLPLLNSTKPRSGSVTTKKEIPATNKSAPSSRRSSFSGVALPTVTPLKRTMSSKK